VRNNCTPPSENKPILQLLHVCRADSRNFGNFLNNLSVARTCAGMNASIAATVQHKRRFVSFNIQRRPTRDPNNHGSLRKAFTAHPRQASDPVAWKFGTRLAKLVLADATSLRKHLLPTHCCCITVPSGPHTIDELHNRESCTIPRPIPTRR